MSADTAEERPVSLPGFLVVLLGWAGFGVVAEGFYSGDPGDWVDIPFVFGVWMLGLLTWGAHAIGWVPVPSWAPRFARSVLDFFGRYDVEKGVDFGGVPDYPHRLPPPLLQLSGALIAAMLVGWLWRDLFPGVARAWLISLGALVYLVYAALLWAWSLFLAFASCFLVGVQVNDVLVNHGHPRRRERRLQSLLIVAVLLLPASAVAVLPPWLPIVILGTSVLIGIGVLLLSKGEQIRFLWRSRGSPKIYAMGSSWLLGWGVLSLSGMVALTIVPTSAATWGGNAGVAPVSELIGTYTGWCGAFAVLSWLVAGPVRLLRLAGKDPSRPVPAALRLLDVSILNEATLAALGTRGFEVLDDEAGREHPLRIDFDERAPRRTATGREEGGQVAWRVHPKDILHPDVLSQLRSADRHMRRRELIRGIRRLLESAKARDFKEGSGFWFAPHLWYVASMTRDKDEETSISVGPPYHRALSPEARRHAYEVFRAVSVDLIFIEDGVPITGVERVLLQVFDHYDLWGVDPIEDRHIFSIPGIRVLVHAFEFDAPLDEEGYPEPDYQSLARGRILHMMKDRGGEEDEEIVPPIPSRRPQLIQV